MKNFWLICAIFYTFCSVDAILLQTKTESSLCSTSASKLVSEITWNPCSQEMHYHVFAANSRDFFPSIYPDPLISISNKALPYEAVMENINLFIGYVPNPHVNTKIWDVITPYLLPEDHPIKAKLDRIFAERVTLNSTSLQEAGFKTPNPRGFSKTVVSMHPDLEGYIVKCFLDNQKDVVDWQKLMRRIKGAEFIKRAIKRHHYEKIFKVPQKWIYPLPEEPSPPSDYYRKNFILIAEDVHILAKDSNYKAWAGPKMTPKKLDAIYTILKEEGLTDSVVAFNIPFTEDDDKLAFIDTEIWHRWPVNYKKLLMYLSPSMQKHWKQLIKNDGPTKK